MHEVIKMGKRVISFLFLALLIASTACTQDLKRAEFAGTWYPKDQKKLDAYLDELFVQADAKAPDGKILGVISPHAGYMYSAPIAAYSFKVLQGRKVDSVILLGPSHHVYFEGLCVYPDGVFETPLGNLAVNKKLATQLAELSFVQSKKKVFSGEHSLEVQLPLVRKALGEVTIVPVLFGQVDLDQLKEFAKHLKKLSAHHNFIVVTSTDLSHYHPYREAVDIDKNTIDLIEKRDSAQLWQTRSFGKGRACGIAPVVAFLEYLRAQGADVQVLKYANSGDTAGDKRRVVGYVSAVGYQKAKESNKGEDMEEFNLTKEEKLKLLDIARKTLESHLKDGKVPRFDAPLGVLAQKRGAFVTLKKHGQLRGCIGRIVADEPLYRVISGMAIESATGDPRFPRVRLDELKDLEIEISVLSPFEEVNDLEEIEVGKHGLMIRKGFYSGLLLPQVPTEYGWDRDTFLEHLCHKAGLPADAYKGKGVRIEKFSAVVFSEEEFKETE